MRNKHPDKENFGLMRIGVAQLVAVGCGATFWLVIAPTLLHPYAYGYLGWLYSIAALLSTVCVLGLGKTIVSRFPKGRKTEFLGVASFAVLLISSIVGTIVSIIIEFWVGMLIIGMSLFSIAFHSELSSRRYGGYMWMWVGLRSASLIIPVLFYVYFGTVSAMIAGFAILHILFGSKILARLRTDISKLRTKIKFAAWVWATDVGTSAVSFADKILIGSLFGWALLGLYQFANRIFLILSVLPQILLFYLLAEKSAGGRTKNVEKAGVSFSLVLAVATFAIAPLVSGAFPHFQESTDAIRIMGFAIIPATVAGIMISELYSRGKAREVLESHFFALGLGVICIVMLGRLYGLIGLAVSLFVLQTSLAASLLIFPELSKLKMGNLVKSALGMLVIALLLLTPLNVRSLHVKIRDGNLVGEGIAMDTIVRITISDRDFEKAKKAMNEAWEEIRRIEASMSVHDESSEIYDLNHAGTDWVKLSPETISVLKKSYAYAELTEGCFDPTVRPLVELWMDKTKKRGKPPDPRELTSAMELVGWKNLIIEENDFRARFTKSGMQITLGGIAKGYAIDRACEILQKHGIENALVEIGGDMRAIGRRTWRIAIQDPRNRLGYLKPIIEITSGSVTTSGDYERFFFLGNKRIHHIIDPRTGTSADGCMGVTIVMENGECIDADALATGVFVMGPENGIALLNSLRIKGLIVSSDGKILTSRSWDFE